MQAQVSSQSLRSGEQESDGRGRCSVCTTDLDPARNDRHPAQVIGKCQCDVHAECLVQQMQNGRDDCTECGEQLSVNDTIRVTIPRQVKDAVVSPLNMEQMVSLGDDCSVCQYSLLLDTEPVGHPDCCQHWFHLRCIIENSYIPARPHARAQSIDPDFPHSQCPLCRREYCLIEAEGAPYTLIHYASLEGEQASRSRPQHRRQQQQQQQNWSEWLLAAGATVFGVAVIIGLVLLRR